ncbi:MAG TPA: SDR family oxidoreductase, partial [Dokdonella sp.]
SSGIGLHLARVLARHGYPLALVAPNRPELDAIAESIRREFGVRADAIAADLEQAGAAEHVFERLRGVDVGVLVNDAGHGQRGAFWELPIERHLSILRLNVEAVLRVTALFLPPMLARGHGRILNVASLAGFEPGPLLAVYHASKAFVLSWSEALAGELEGRPVTVTTLCPGPTDTDFFAKAGLEGTRGFQQLPVAAPQEVAEAGYRGMIRGDRLVVPGLANKAFAFSRRLLSESMQATVNKKMYENLPPDRRRRARGDLERRGGPRQSR